MKPHIYHQVCGFHVGEFEAGKYNQCCFCDTLPTCTFRDDEKVEELFKKIKQQTEGAPEKYPEDKMDLNMHEKEMKGL